MLIALMESGESTVAHLAAATKRSQLYAGAVLASLEHRQEAVKRIEGGVHFWRVVTDEERKQFAQQEAGRAAGKKARASRRPRAAVVTLEKPAAPAKPARPVKPVAPVGREAERVAVLGLLGHVGESSTRSIRSTLGMHANRAAAVLVGLERSHHVCMRLEAGEHGKSQMWRLTSEDERQRLVKEDAQREAARLAVTSLVPTVPGARVVLLTDTRRTESALTPGHRPRGDYVLGLYC